MPTSPIFLGNKAKRLLERAVWNDTSFLASIDVMDFSLLAGVDKEKNQLVHGIIGSTLWTSTLRHGSSASVFFMKFEK
ncbi:hypothetical protein MKX03_014962 [Papaver bracteatum]|nr:hypothetical protein MKX03_014962 [Papaver bracteatum]